MREPLRDKERLLHIIEAIDNIFEFIENKEVADYKKDKILRFAVIKNLEIAGEAAYLLSRSFKEKHKHIEWADIIGMRHVLVHGYYNIKDEIVWETIKTEIKPLRDKIMPLISEFQ